jgi:hypothetical protein
MGAEKGKRWVYVVELREIMSWERILAQMSVGKPHVEMRYYDVNHFSFRVVHVELRRENDRFTLIKSEKVRIGKVFRPEVSDGKLHAEMQMSFHLKRKKLNGEYYPKAETICPKGAKSTFRSHIVHVDYSNPLSSPSFALLYRSHPNL